MTLKQTLEKHQALADYHTDMVKELEEMMPKEQITVHRSPEPEICESCQ
jgi:hypothetical protein